MKRTNIRTSTVRWWRSCVNRLPLRCPIDVITKNVLDRVSVPGKSCGHLPSGPHTKSGIIIENMRLLQFLLKLPLFLIADVFLWLVAFTFGRWMILSENRRLEVVEKHKRMVDWLWGVPAEFRFRTQRDRF